MKILGREIHLFPNPITERFKGKVVTLGSKYGRRKTFYTGEASWRSRCDKFHHDYETHVLAKQALISIAGQAIAEGIYLQPVTNKQDETYPRAEEAVKKCEELNNRIQIKKLLFDTFFYMAKYGSYFWEKTWTPQFDCRGIPFVEYLEPAEADDLGTIVKWRQNIQTQSNTIWTSEEIVPFHWNPTSYSYPYGTSLLIGLDNEFVALEETEDAIKDYTVKHAYPYEVYQMGEGDDKPLEEDLNTFASKLKNRDPGETFLTTVKSQILQGGTLTSPMRDMGGYLEFLKNNATDGMMMPPLSKLYNSTEASAKVVQNWASNILIKPMQEIVKIQLQEYVYKPFLEDLGYSVKLCPDVLFESPDAAKTETMEFWKGMVEAGICPPVVAAREFGWEDEFKDWEQKQRYEQERMTQNQQMSGEQNTEYPAGQQQQQDFGESWIVTKRQPTKESKRFLSEEDECTANGGVWRTVQGRHICIRKGESISDALDREFGNGDDKEGDFRKELEQNQSKQQLKTLPFEVEGADEVEKRIIKNSIGRNTPEQLATVKKITVVDEADFYTIDGVKHSAQATYSRSKQEIKMEKYFLTDPEGPRIINHEIGHGVWNTLKSHEQNEWHSVFNRGLKHGDYGFPSFYATTNHEECFAECYGYYKSGREREVGGIFLEYLKRFIKG